MTYLENLHAALEMSKDADDAMLIQHLIDQHVLKNGNDNSPSTPPARQTMEDSKTS